MAIKTVARQVAVGVLVLVIYNIGVKMLTDWSVKRNGNDRLAASG